MQHSGDLRMQSPRMKSLLHGAIVAIFATLACTVVSAQDTPLLSGGVGFFSSTNGGNTTYIPIIEPVLAAPIGQHLLVESRADLLEIFFPVTAQGYQTSHFVGLSYLQADVFATKHITVVGGYFLTPFGTYNERLTPIWISNFQTGPLLLPIGAVASASSTGGMLRGNAYATEKVSIDYAAYFSAASTNEQFSSQRSAGGRMDVYFPRKRLEISTSYNYLLQGNRSANEGVDVWWQPASVPLKIRSAYAHAAHAQGYWIETDYRLSHWGGEFSKLGRLEPVFRWQQIFRNQPDPSDSLPGVNTQRADFGLDYHFPHEIRINTSYSRQFSATHDVNIWETGIIYRFLFPAWKGKL
jgi:hypothetical protein